MIRRVALVGFGAVAEGAHLAALRSLNVNVEAVYEPAPERRDAARRRIPQANVYHSLDSLLETEISLDALIVCSPPRYHADAVLSGIRAGLHVLCEKPLTLSSGAFEDIRRESESRDRCVYAINNWAYSPQWSKLLQVAARGILGEIRHAEIRVLRTRPSASCLPGDWRKDPAISGGGILVDHGWHNLYLLRRLLGPRLELSSAVLHPEDAVDETATLTFQAPAAEASIHMSWRAAERSNWTLVNGEKATAELKDDSLCVKGPGLDQLFHFPEKLSAGSAHPDWLTAMWPSFESECSGRERGENLAEAAFCLATIGAAYERARDKDGVTRGQ
ncbi:MAG: Gfo/Idh/MocA family oxidoreductase [Elusimicrobiota bacterium]